MKILVEVDVEPLPKNRMLAFHSKVGEATAEGRTFEITSSLTGLGLALHEEVDGKIVTHTFSMHPVIQAAIEAVVAS